MARKRVYLWKTGHHVVRDESNVSQRYATLEAIARCRGEAIMNTWLEVDESQLDARGFVTDTGPDDSDNGSES